MVEANWHCDFGKEGRDLWRHLLEPYDAELGTRAVARLAKNPLPANRARPQLSDLRSVLVMLSRESNYRRALAPARHAKPGWVDRWERARDVGDFRIFPEQAPGYRALQHSDDPNVADDPLNVIAYALPDSPQDDATDWVQPHEYTEAAA